MLSSFVSIAVMTAHLLAPGLYGDVREGSGYAAGAVLHLSCGSESASATTDNSGSFRFSMKSPGRCTLTATYKSQTTKELEVVLYDKPVSCRLKLEQQDGKYVLAFR